MAADTRAAGPCSARTQRKPLGPAAAPAPLIWLADVQHGRDALAELSGSVAQQGQALGCQAAVEARDRYHPGSSADAPVRLGDLRRPQAHRRTPGRRAGDSGRQDLIERGPGHLSQARPAHPGDADGRRWRRHASRLVQPALPCQSHPGRLARGGRGSRQVRPSRSGDAEPALRAAAVRWRRRAESNRGADAEISPRRGHHLQAHGRVRGRGAAARVGPRGAAAG